MDEMLNNWFNELHEPQRQKLTELRKLVLDVDASFTEEIKWGQPCFSINKLICYLQSAKGHVTIGFQKGAHLEDPKNILAGMGKDMRHTKNNLSDEMDRSAIADTVSKAVEFDRR